MELINEFSFQTIQKNCQEKEAQNDKIICHAYAHENPDWICNCCSIECPKATYFPVVERKVELAEKEGEKECES